MPRESEWGTERSRHGPFAPRAGRRWRQLDEGLFSGRQQDRWPIAARCRRQCRLPRSPLPS
ncbi:hypothetical protein ELH25_00730 [Rhizobium ruizarguesonis]|nr:hypothetical protein ELH25_00730 [Rhizobium ruizarguesonis]